MICDIIEMRPYSRFKRLPLHTYHHRYVKQAVTLKSKSGSETANAIAEIIRKSGRHPRNLQTDMGKEFYNADVCKLLKKIR